MAFCFHPMIYVISIELSTLACLPFLMYSFSFLPFLLPPLSFLRKNVYLHKVFSFSFHFQIEIERRAMYYSIWVLQMIANKLYKTIPKVVDKLP